MRTYETQSLLQFRRGRFWRRASHRDSRLGRLINTPLETMLISTELMARLAGRGAKVKEVDVQHLPRLTGEQSGANLKVVMKAFRELFALYQELKAERQAGK